MENHPHAVVAGLGQRRQNQRGQNGEGGQYDQQVGQREGAFAPAGVLESVMRWAGISFHSQLTFGLFLQFLFQVPIQISSHTGRMAGLSLFPAPVVKMCK